MNHQYDAAAVDLDAAEAAAGRTRSPAPNRSLMHMIRAVHAAGRGDLQATVDHAEAAVTLTPDFYSRSLAEAHLVFGCLLLGRRDAALEVVASGAPAPVGGDAGAGEHRHARASATHPPAIRSRSLGSARVGQCLPVTPEALEPCGAEHHQHDAARDERRQADR